MCLKINWKEFPGRESPKEQIPVDRETGEAGAMEEKLLCLIQYLMQTK